MSNWGKAAAWSALVVLAGNAIAQGQATAELDLPSRLERYSEHHVIRADGTETVTISQQSRALKTETLGHSASAQRLQIVEAYTIKANGRKLPLPKSNYQLRTAGGKAGGQAAFSDWNENTVVYPDFPVGDAVASTYRLVTIQPLFPGKVSYFASFPRQYAYDKVKISFDAPVAMDLRHAARGMEIKESRRGDRRLIEMSLPSQEPIRNDREDFSVYDAESEPGYSVSSFKSHAEIAERYVELARAKAQPTPKMRQLADQIVSSQVPPAEQVKAFYDWVAEHITYAGNCVGIGAVVPRDL